MNKIAYFLFIFFSFNIFFGQQQIDSIKLKSNPIIYSEILLGYAGGSENGFSVGAQINYQKEKNLYTFRFQNQTKIKSDAVRAGFVAIPYFYTESTIDEYSLLYGRRFIDENKSYSFSLGLSTNTKRFKFTENTEFIKTKNNYIGVPFELNVKWFKRKKKRFRAYYGLIPIGKATSFGRSFGFKLYGNVSETSYIGFGITIGYGWHKKY